MSAAIVVSVVIGIVILVTGLYAGLAWLLMAAWNGVGHGVFHGPSLNYVQSCLAFLLLSIVGGFFSRTTKS